MTQKEKQQKENNASKKIVEALDGFSIVDANLILFNVRNIIENSPVNSGVSIASLTSQSSH